LLVIIIDEPEGLVNDLWRQINSCAELDVWAAAHFVHTRQCCVAVLVLLQVAASERMAEVWVQLASELGASPEELAAVRTNDTGLLATASQPPQA
jgi:hypothetical protein